MACSFRVACLFAAAVQVSAYENVEQTEDCFFDSVSAAALSLLQKSAKLVGVSTNAHSSASSAAAASMPAAPLLRSIVVPLQKVGFRRADGFLAARTQHIRETRFHVGTISVGNPSQRFEVLFDTSSMYSWLVHERCQSLACKEHRRYSPSKSLTAIDVDHEGLALAEGYRLVDGTVSREAIEVRYSQSDLGEGDMRSWFVRDNICLGQVSAGEACVDMALATAIELDDEPFRSMPGDGIIGLSLEAFGTSHMNNFLGRLFERSSNVIPQFGIWLGQEAGEIHLGGHELADLASPIRWLPVYRPEDGYWQAEILSVRVGNVTVNDCSSGCHGIVDTGVSHLGVQAALLPALMEALVPMSAPGGGCEGPDLIFDMGDVVLVLEAKDYAGKDCVPHLGALNLEEPLFNGVFAFGETVLQRYYAAFDWEQRRLGFAMLSESPIPAGKNAPRSMRGAVVV